jgi:transcription antitermination factor NusG
MTGERAWYVVHCYSGYENKVRHNLEQRIETMGMKDKIFDVVIPTQEEIEVKDGKRRTVERHVFPGYVLVNMIMTEESWYVVRNTPGVTGFVGMGNQPTPCALKKFRRSCAAWKPKPRASRSPSGWASACALWMAHSTISAARYRKSTWSARKCA